ncbi:probable WRKY transcription factor 14 [Olea europaea var. sylvestris]|uniref:probable WRKY transcription factor 14 n=1 Tax=Olea europaea var. sylvestris TaxID=158386 RepID=UPI000C1D20B5|nr:probable WRKY transcription factor 14 [Olea europaea var. sylvestris]
MCSHFLERMNNYQGDLDDIIRAGGGGMGSNTSTSVPTLPADWKLPSNPFNFSSGIEELSDYFGNPFSSMRDPFLHDTDTTASGFFNNSNYSIDTGKRGTGGAGAGGGGGDGGGDSILGNKIVDDEMKTGPPNIFSRMLQISPNEKSLVFHRNSSAVSTASHGGLKATAISGSVSNDHMISPNGSKSCLVESPGVQISPPPNTAIKRRKSQAKKVVCIPAPAPANNRPGGGGEVVPSDLWAWRKYGQKPIKGSPYPRGYYRCSSSKGCSARKQVERSRTDPNMLVITYTSEHNHPWPTQRNALAGSTRSQPSKNNIPASKTRPNSESQRAKSPNDEETGKHSENVISSPVDIKKEDLDNHFEIDDAELYEGFPSQSYRPALLGSNQSEDLFADLGEIEVDPSDLLFMDGFSGDELGRENKALDPFSFYDWPRNNNNSNCITTSYEEPKSLRGIHDDDILKQQFD